MRLVFVLFDSLNRLALEHYGGKHVRTPNFTRFAKRAVSFNRHYVGSLPCMPARRDLHTGRINFLHRSWGPLEPFDNSFPQLLSESGAYTHIITDHSHYFHDGGATYHNRYDSWELVRGQANDHWKGVVEPPLEEFAATYHPSQLRPFIHSDRINRLYVKEEKDFACPQIFDLASHFLDVNGRAKNWLLQIECFDPHEPFYAPPRFRDAYPTAYGGPVFDWPMYGKVKESRDEIDEVRANYAALVAMCDEYFGRLLDQFDRMDLWRDTALVVTTDHGFLLGEHDWWGKNLMPVYDELARIPLMIYHPDYASSGGSMREALTQATDIMPTFLDWFGVEAPKEVTGTSLTPLLAAEEKIRNSAIYGYFGAACNITDGRYTYLRYPESMSAEGLHEYTLMPTRFGRLFSIKELVDATLAPPFDFTKGLSVLKVSPQMMADGRVSAMDGVVAFEDAKTRLFDIERDPSQSTPLADSELENRLCGEMARQLRLHDAPPSLFTRLGLDGGLA
ncbi:MAG: sulfatase [Rhizobiales bacterium]|nr:sulfatase [Hyphomicrobiales bacterium]